MTQPDLTSRDNMLKAARFERPDFIPMRFHINTACWHHYPQDAIKELKASHPLLFPGYTPETGPVVPDHAPWQRAGQPYTDPWGCIWETADNGITGAVVKHPLADWAALDTYSPPSPERFAGWGPVDWAREAKEVDQTRARGKLTAGGLRHGHTFLSLTYLRGYENLIFDMTDDEPRLWKLIAMLEDFNLEIVRRYIKLGVERMEYPEDLGMQVGPMLSVNHFHKYIQPSYRRLIAPAREAGCIIHMHSDGDIRDLVDGLVEGGVQVINLQDLVNGIDWIKQRLAGRICIDLDIDRQKITRFGTPDQIDALIREEVEKLGSREGGLWMLHGWYPGVPLANIRALMNAMEKYAGYYS